MTRPFSFRTSCRAGSLSRVGGATGGEEGRKLGARLAILPFGGGIADDAAAGAARLGLGFDGRSLGRLGRRGLDRSSVAHRHINAGLRRRSQVGLGLATVGGSQRHATFATTAARRFAALGPIRLGGSLDGSILGAAFRTILTLLALGPIKTLRSLGPVLTLGPILALVILTVLTIAARETLLAILARLLLTVLTLILTVAAILTVGAGLALLLLGRALGMLSQGIDGLGLLAVVIILIVILTILVGPHDALRLGRRDDAEIMFGVLEIILRHHRVARSLRIARQLHVFFGDVGGIAAQLHVRPVAFEAPVQRIEVLAPAIVVVAAPA
ncbi:hypothetical protein SAMN02983003_2968 [Devosia enhydra]|uniref:Uncharacterized protein n=1 Tax=Devosia enhydra TaxID=665118 RepID=A0A1K2I097_9HYPH|nr:hypothetical protein SAMN02983003_2968 [Devosia enhydra]